MRPWTLALALGALAAACDDASPKSASLHARPDQIPEAVDIAPQTMTSGFALAALRQKQDVAAFRITRTPITVARYRQCVTSGACTAPASESLECSHAADTHALYGATYDLPDGGDLPVTCASASQAAAYCAWVGGSLPTSSQWQLAARGTDVHRFAWGDTDPVCELSLGASNNPYCATGGVDKSIVGQSPFAASPTGVQDVLLTPAELVRGSADSELPACGGDDRYCAMRGLKPRAIDFATPVARDPKGPAAAAIPTYGFRCVWSGGNP
jgi:formylglycine-generating enzyme required for sulfatase activity